MTKKKKTDNEKALAKQKKAYPFEYRAPYEGIPRDVNMNFVWISFQKEGYAMFLFQTEEDRDSFADRYPPQEAEAA